LQWCMLEQLKVVVWILSVWNTYVCCPAYEYVWTLSVCNEYYQFAKTGCVNVISLQWILNISSLWFKYHLKLASLLNISFPVIYHLQTSSDIYQLSKYFKFPTRGILVISASI
jgi:hypothetical protein